MQVKVLHETPLLEYISSRKDRDIWNKAFICEVIFPGESYNFQTHFDIEGILDMKITPLGAKLSVL